MKTTRFASVACLALMLASLLLAAGCSSVRRQIIAQHWHDSETLYVSYVEQQSMFYFFGSGSSAAQSLVMKCRVAPDNAVNCKPQESLNPMLNKR